MADTPFLQPQMGLLLAGLLLVSGPLLTALSLTLHPALGHMVVCGTSPA